MATFPYSDAQGNRQLREQIASLFWSFHGVPLSAEAIVVVPNRARAITTMVDTFEMASLLIDEELYGSLGLRLYASVTELSNHIGIVCDVATRLRPACIVMRLREEEAACEQRFLRLEQVTRDLGAQVVLDVSLDVDLTRRPLSCAVIRRLARGALAPHMCLLFGWMPGRSYPDFEGAFLLTENSDFIEAFRSGVELSYSRCSQMAQDYHRRMLADLRGNRTPCDPGQVRHPSRSAATSFKLRTTARAAFSHPAVITELTSWSSSVIRMDYGENELPAPASLKSSVAQALLNHQAVSSEASAEVGVRRHWQGRFVGLDKLAFQETLGIAPAHAEIAQNLARAGRTLFLPTGSYGMFVASHAYYGLRTRQITTHRDSGFKITLDDLETLGTEAKGQALYVCGPVVNPTGQIYSNDELQGIFRWCERHDVQVILDAAFSGLEFEDPEPIDLPERNLYLLGSFSKEFSAGGLRYGFVFRDPSRPRLCTEPPHRLAGHSIQRFLDQPGVGADRRTLAEHAKKLQAVLDASWEVLSPRGGLFLVAKPRWPGLSAETLAHKHGVLVNDPVWTQLPEHFRFVFSLEPEKFAQALRRLERVAPAAGNGRRCQR